MSTAHESSAKTWDAIVIGSGMGGMTAAAALSRVGNKVLLLEQYEKLGGLTHSFGRDGFRWDVGLHYMGGLAPGEVERGILDWLSETPMDFESMGAVYDTLHIGDAEPLQLSRPYEAQEMDLKDRFPDDGDAIEAWMRALQDAREAIFPTFQARAMPAAFGKVVTWWNRRAIQRWCGRTTSEVASDITDNPALAAALMAQWGDHGGRPSRASFALHATAVGSYLECGAWYPVGGAGIFAERIIPVITSAGGEARAGVRVDALILDGETVQGVVTDDGEEIRADVVISDIGARETVEHLLPDNCAHQDWIEEIRALDPSICHFTLFLGFEGDVEGAGATRSNHWLYPGGEIDAVWTDAPEGVPTGMFVSFASLKDPAHDPGPNQKHVGEMLVWTNWSTVQRWADRAPGTRGDDYQAFKTRIENTLFQQFEQYFPDLAKLVVFRELATPFSTEAITGHYKGAFYGLDVTPQRALSDALRMTTPFDNLYLAGQDVVSPGIMGAMWGGLLAAACVDRKVLAHMRG
ncbi:MAG: NAD(P)/FAD-dependent oxidoreductase [Hyphomicrobiales bacterium]|nr:NAD(P)/FAD-dependent oxidoreductase [Hyphomicrobiales bacterium]